MVKLVFDWDQNKAESNLRKHGVNFEEAKTVFDDPYLITIFDEFHSLREDRLITIGFSEKTRLLLVVHTEEEISTDTHLIRIISCRKATVSEKMVYEKGGDE